MTQYDDSMKGVLFKNDQEGNEKRPQYKGNGEVGGAKVWISAWVRKSQAGKPYLSLAFELKDGESFGTAPVGSDVPIATDDFTAAPVVDDDDIPFKWDGPTFDTDQVKTHSNR